MMQLCLDLQLETPVNKSDEFTRLLLKVREETRCILEAAIAISGTKFQSLTQVPTPLLAQAREQVFGVAEQRSPVVIPDRRPTTKKGSSWSALAKYGQPVDLGEDDNESASTPEIEVEEISVEGSASLKELKSGFE